ncbi:FAD synthetase family protein [Amycolatopsis thermoflava]|uniref:FAD synthase n=1 Tax=Amycolatopsis thermoflava TaxID=84480 RepID=A0A3N2H5W4_9PSEU|nr:FAD synthetase family protein [Amycolatopsis thermoflava]ROS44311.1 riboflavin kinase/FMN adenylyltransferase [Amycolatopsis thermoflava]
MDHPGAARTTGSSPARCIDVREVRPRPRMVAVGTFDGVHLGHARVIAGCETVLTFSPHPRSVVRPGDGPRLLTDGVGKRRRLAALGVREVVVIPFDREWAAMDATTFIDEVLVGRLGAVRVAVGADFRFGARGVGDAQTLRADGRFTTTVARMVTVDDDTVSSSRIRELIAAGEVERAARLLGRPHTLPARALGGTRLSLDPALAIPRPNRYMALVDGSGTQVTVLDDGVIELERRRAAGPVEVVFLSRS